jgi:uroporphyrinogen-III synthase
MNLLIIRPLPGSDATADRAVAAGFTPIVMPLFAVSPATWAVPDAAEYDAILVTSANALRHGGAELSKLKRLPVYAVGAATAATAQQSGFTVAASGEGGGTDILQIASNDKCRRIVWLAGANTIKLDALPGMQLDQIIVYQSAALAGPADFADILRQKDLVAALHSPRAARHFASQCDINGVDRSAIMLAALSPAVAIAAGQGWRDVAIADAPNDDALLSAAKSCFTSSHRDPYC